MNTEEHVVESSSSKYSRKVWLLNAGAPEKVGIFLDGEFYVNQMDAPSLLIHLQSTGVIPSMLCAFVSHVNGAARHQDLICNPEYSDFIATDLVDWLRKKSSTVSDRNHLIAGTSLGGLASTYLSLIRPELFPNCLSHSGSFWWNNEWLMNNLGQMPVSKNKFWLSVGDKETGSGVAHPPTGLRQEVTQISACERFSAALITKGHTVHYNLYAGGHETRCWKDELPHALSWLLG